MPRRSSLESLEEDEVEDSRKRPSRRGAKSVSYAEGNAEGDDDPMDVDENPASESDDEAEMAAVDTDVEEVAGGRRRSRSRNAKKGDASKENITNEARRTSSRSTKFKDSMKEPTDKSIRDLMKETTATTTTKGKGKTTSRRKGSDESNFEDESEGEDDDKDDDEMDIEATAPKKSKRQGKRGKKNKKKRKQQLPDSPRHKSPARRHKQTRLSISSHKIQVDHSDDSSVESHVDEEDEEAPFKIQRIIASRTERRNAWSEICKNMNTSEIDYGSRWVQDPLDEQDDSYEERFLVKWADLSYMHVSWETESDLLDQVDGAKTYLSTFFRKSSHGLLFGPDERCDGDYFDPAWTQVDRILEVVFPEECPRKSVKDEDSITNEALGIVLDKNSPEFENGLGREFLVRWGNTGYSDCSYEFERDLVLNEIDYKDDIRSFNQRKKRPSKDKAKKALREGEAEKRRLYKAVFGDNSDSKVENGVEEYQLKLQEHVYKNGGQLRDYQAEGVSWLMSNLINNRSSILADEMGLGKTLQTAAFVNLVATQLNRRGPFLIVAPLSTLAHWQREFQGWTNLNTIVYHGSAEDRQLIREFEIAHESLRPQGGVGFNQLYLRKCRPKKNNPVVGNPWMAEVVITTPELICADDFLELTAVEWEVLVVDEAQKLKNHNSKLANSLRDHRFVFGHKLLLTGTPIQNTMQELFALLNFIDPDLFGNCDEFMEKYGDIKSKEKIDELHEEIRPYILRRLKEDVEKSVPPKEETVIEVELTTAQKQYYRALYEKNVKFLHKNKKKALDGPSLSNLAMQLRKCCNHLFLLNGIEEEFRAKQLAEGLSLTEGDMLVKASGKLVLLDKLLPRLKEKGHRLLIFSQFKIMLDVLEDYLNARVVSFERIDGSITGKKRQQAIDRFQAPTVEGKDQPFIMLLSTRAGGVGINLTSADTVIIFDSDFNPQNDLQAQARCHRIGQTKSVQVYRLLCRQSYEMQMFHMSSLKMGLDQAVLSGFESGTSGDNGGLSKDEVEKLLRHGAYGIFSEGNGEEASNDFVQQDIDTILERRSRLVVHENTGSKNSAAGSTFSKARFTAPKGAEGKKAAKEDVSVDDPDFWKKMVGEGHDDADADDLSGKRRKRTVMDYSEGAYEKKMNQALLNSDAENDDDDEDSGDDESYDSDNDTDQTERFRWGGSKASNWKHEEAKKLVNLLHAYGYGTVPWSRYLQELAATNAHGEAEIQRMSWSMVLTALCEVAEDDATQAKKRAARAAEKKREGEDERSSAANGGVLGSAASAEEMDALIQKSFDKLWVSNASWAASALNDALLFAQMVQPRSDEVLSRVSRSVSGTSTPPKDEITTKFAETVWPSLKSRGWKASVVLEGPNSGKTQYSYEGKNYYSPESVLAAAGAIHQELANVLSSMRIAAESSRQKSQENEAKLRQKHLSMKAGTIDIKEMAVFLSKYAPLQLLFDRKHHKKLHISARKMLHACSYMYTATALVKKAEASRGSSSLVDKLSSMILVDKRNSLPHPLWSVKHDAVLVSAIAKHGWIDNDWSCRRIIKDAEIKWGFPFDCNPGVGEPGDDKKTSERDVLISSLRETADRAADVFNIHSDVLEEVKGFNQALVVRAYSLIQEDSDETDVVDTANENADESSPREWKVDDVALLASTGLSSNGPQENVELPPKKDLAKRVKTILQRSADTIGTQTGACGAQQADTISPSPFCVLDQSERCNVLLAEIVRAIVKAPFPKSQKAMRMLCAIACEEAGKRRESLASSQSQDKKRAKAAEEMAEAIKNIDLAKRCLKQTRQAKNILRVMLGTDVVKHPKDPVFPGESTMGGMGPSQKSGSRSPTNGARSNKKEDGSIGDRSLARAMSKCLDKNGGGPGTVLPEGHSTDLQLTAIETLIISVACSQGLPVWTEDAALELVPADKQSAENATEYNAFVLPWHGLGRVLDAAAKEWHATAARKVEVCQVEYDKHQDRDENFQPKVRARKNLAKAIKIEEVKEVAARQAVSYAEEPSILAQKTVMLIERVRKMMGNNVAAHIKSTKKVNYWLGPKVFDFFSSDLNRWAQTMEIDDGLGRTLSYTAADFYHDLKPEEREAIEITTTLSKNDCRQIVIQISAVTRLRSLFLKYPKEELHKRIESAAKNCKMGDTWETQPSWWRSHDEDPSRHDALLLEALVEYGFGAVLEHGRGFGPPDVKADTQLSLKDHGLTKAIIQQRCNQLARELHSLERSDDILRVLDKSRAKQSTSVNNAANTLSPTSKMSKTPTTAKIGTKQTALESFFSMTRSSKKAGSAVMQLESEDGAKKQVAGNVVIEVDASPRSRGNEVIEVDASPQGKDNKDASDRGDTATGEKCPGTAVSGEKRSEAGTMSTSPSPEKKVRTS